MRKGKLDLPVVYADNAIKELDEIADWNESTFGLARAESYIAFLVQHLDGLGKNYLKGRAIAARPEYRFIRIRKRTGGYGHLAVYKIEPDCVRVLHVFHEAQDWQQLVERDDS